MSALVDKYATRDTETLPPDEVLRMPTISGARALGLESEVGSLDTPHLGPSLRSDRHLGGVVTTLGKD